MKSEKGKRRKIADTKFGISKEKYKKAEKAASLQSIYDFDDGLGEIAFYVSDRFNITLEQAFEIVWRCIEKKEDSSK